MLNSTRDFASTVRAIFNILKCIGTPYYMSPEQFKYKPYSYKSDIWALGCVLYEICNLKHAFTAQTLNGLAVKILKGNYLPISTKYSRGLRELVMSMLNTNPKKRPTIYDILKKPTIKKRLVAYVINLYKSHSGEDDLYLETVKKQCKSLELDALIEKYMHKSMPPNLEFSNERDEKLKERRKKKEQELKTSLQVRDNIQRQIEILEKKINSKRLGAKEKVLYDKKRRKLKELQQREAQLEAIRTETERERELAKKKFENDMKSRNIKNIMNQDDALAESYNSDFDEMQFDDNDFVDDEEMNIIDEVDEEEELDGQLANYRKQLEDNTQNIQKIKEDLKETTKKLNYDLSETENQYDDEIDAISQETPFNISDLEDSEDGYSEERGGGGLGKTFENKIKDMEM